jgi:hypothetical protein
MECVGTIFLNAKLFRKAMFCPRLPTCAEGGIRDSGRAAAPKNRRLPHYKFWGAMARQLA